jgi:two-component system, OmpR family, sensor histidine kinase RstB
MLRLFLPLYLLVFLFVLFFLPAFESALNQFAADEVIEDKLGDFEGAFYLIEHVLLDTDPATWADELERMSSRNIPVHLVERDQLLLSARQQQQLAAGEIVVTDIHNSIMHKALSGHTQLIQVGPVATTASLNLVYLLLMLGGSLILLLLVGLWVWQVQLRITHLGRVTERFGKGDFSVRASMSLFRVVGRLNGDFNRMAKQVQDLIESHKHLTNAVSHELRTPIARIRFELEYTQTQQDPAELHRSLDSIAEDTQELEKLVSELLHYARFERSHLELPRESLPLGPWLQEWQQQYRIIRQDLTLTLQLPADRNGSQRNAVFNAEALTRALNNLVQNACRYARQKILIRLQWSDDGQVSICVDDDGPGIPPEQRQSLFDPFVRADRSRSRDTGGVGLGLAIVARIMLHHEGGVCVEDSELGGARLRLWW